MDNTPLHNTIKLNCEKVTTIQNKLHTYYIFKIIQCFNLSFLADYIENGKRNFNENFAIRYVMFISKGYPF